MSFWARVGWSTLGGVLTCSGLAWAAAQEAPARAAPLPESNPLASILADGDAAFESGDYAAAVAAYSRISPIEIPPEAQNRLGVAYHLSDMGREAEATYRVATARYRDYAAAYNNLGALYYGRTEFGDAEDRFRDALEYQPSNSVIQANLHAARYARENGRTVRMEIERIAGENPLLVDGLRGETLAVSLLIDPEVREELRMLELRGDVFVARKLFEDAIVEYRRYLDIDEYDAMVTNKLGITYQQAQRISDAEDSYRRALRLNPRFVAAFNNLGSLEQGRGDYRRALDYYRRALEVDEESPTVLQNLGSCLFAMERYEDGLAAYIRAMQIDPGLFDRIAGRGGTLVQTAPGNESMTNFYLAKLFAGAGDLDRTMSFLYRAVEEGFDNAALLDDPVFSDLRSDERFVRLVTALQESS